MAFVAAAVIGGVATVGGAVMQSQAAQNAANAQSQAGDRAMQMQQKQYDQQRADMAPYLQAGTKSLGELQTAMPDLTRQFGANDFHEDPGYQFTLQQGLNAMQRSAAAKGFLDSTGTMQNLNNYAQDSASNQYQNAYNRFTQNQQQRYNMMSGIAGMGNTANGQMANVGMNYANNVGNNMMGQGNAMAAGAMAQGNSFSNALNSGANGYMNMSMMNKMFPSGGGGGGGINPSYGSQSLGQNMGALGGGDYRPQPNYLGANTSLSDLGSGG